MRKSFIQSTPTTHTNRSQMKGIAMRSQLHKLSWSTRYEFLRSVLTNLALLTNEHVSYTMLIHRKTFLFIFGTRTSHSCARATHPIKIVSSSTPLKSLSQLTGTMNCLFNCLGRSHRNKSNESKCDWMNEANVTHKHVSNSSAIVYTGDNEWHAISNRFQSIR